VCNATELRNQAVTWTDVLPNDEDQVSTDPWPDPTISPAPRDAAPDLGAAGPTDIAEPEGLSPRTPVTRRATAEELAALLSRVVRQDEAALAEVYTCMSGPVYTVVLRITRRVDLAEEVLQDTFWQIWRQAPRFDPARGSAASWIVTIARSRAMDAVRSSQRSQARISPANAADIIESCADTAPDPLDLLAEVRRNSLLHSALSRLDPLKRQLIGLAFFRGLTQEDIAAQTGLPLGTVKSHLRRTFAVLREALGTDGEFQDLGRRT
jgi:RNA polymerase sigma-70 factor (ECF subfamily)